MPASNHRSHEERNGEQEAEDELQLGGGSIDGGKHLGTPPPCAEHGAGIAPCLRRSQQSNQAIPGEPAANDGSDDKDEGEEHLEGIELERCVATDKHGQGAYACGAV